MVVGGGAAAVVGGGVAVGKLVGEAAGVCALVMATGKMEQTRMRAQNIESILFRWNCGKQ